MKKLNGSLMIALLLSVTSCNPKITTTISRTYPPIDYREEVTVIGLGDIEPDNAEFIGQVRIGDSGFSTNCSYAVVLEKALLEARKAGGNAIKIIEHQLPSAFGSSCHRITAKILKIEDVYNLKPVNEEIIPGIDYAILNIYRYGGSGALVSYDLHLGDSVICRVTNSYKTTLHIAKDGLNTIWAKTESKSEVPVKLEFGKTYYLRCGITMGAFVGRPKLELVDPKTGKQEFESFNARNK